MELKGFWFIFTWKTTALTMLFKVILIDSDFSALANMKFNLELNKLRTGNRTFDNISQENMIVETTGTTTKSQPPRKEELECLVQGGVLMALRGGVPMESLGVAEKWKVKIEKDLPLTLPGHPALDENGKNASRRILIALCGLSKLRKMGSQS